MPLGEDRLSHRTVSVSGLNLLASSRVTAPGNSSLNTTDRVYVPILLIAFNDILEVREELPFLLGHLKALQGAFPLSLE